MKGMTMFKTIFMRDDDSTYCCLSQMDGYSVRKGINTERVVYIEVMQRKDGLYPQMWYNGITGIAKFFFKQDSYSDVMSFLNNEND